MAKSTTPSDARHALDFLAESAGSTIPAVVAVFGDESFLKRMVLTEVRKRASDGDDAEFSCTELDGDKATPRDVFDELSTLSLFGGGRRVVVIEDADKFVSDYRDKLEDYVAKPSPGGVLVLEVSSWASNTRLYKATAASGLNIQCTSPPEAGLVKWLVAWAKQRYQAKLQQDAAESLVEMVGPELGLLDQEIAKLAAASGTEPITVERVEQLVGSWRAKTAWDMIDAVVEGRTAEAFGRLDRLIAAGEHPIALLAQMASTLRRFAAATRLLERDERSGRRPMIRQLLQDAGFKPFVLDKAERQWRQLGRRRAGAIYGWLLDADQALKGRSSAPARARLVLEQMTARMSTAADTRQLKS